MRRVYISHPFMNKTENREKVEKIILDIVREYDDIVPVSPIHAFGFLYDKVDYDTGIKYCLELLKTCDEMWMFGDWYISVGCIIEKNFASEHGIPIFEGKKLQQRREALRKIS